MKYTLVSWRAASRKFGNEELTLEEIVDGMNVVKDNILYEMRDGNLKKVCLGAVAGKILSRKK